MTRLDSGTAPDAVPETIHAGKYDGSKYHAVQVVFYECDCGYRTQRGDVNERGEFAGAVRMVAHLKEKHGYERWRVDV